MANRIPRVPVREQDPKVRATNFEEVCYGYNVEEAMLEASRCLHCKNPRCVGACPVGIKIPDFIEKVKDGDFTAAAAVIAEDSSLPAICINDPAYMTCTANDFSFDEVFSRYVSGVGREGDVLLAISTSGTSPNVLKAVDAAREKGIKVVALTSQGGVPLSERADIAVCAPRCPHSDRVQEIHIKVIHILIECIERRLDV